jgi:uncharacterized protein YaaN involved in tellurite resistance
MPRIISSSDTLVRLQNKVVALDRENQRLRKQIEHLKSVVHAAEAAATASNNAFQSLLKDNQFSSTIPEVDRD